MDVRSSMQRTRLVEQIKANTVRGETHPSAPAASGPGQADIIDLKPGMQVDGGQSGDRFGVRLPPPAGDGGASTGSTERSGPDTGKDVSATRGDTRGRKVTPDEFDRGRQLEALLDPWRDLGARPDAHGQGPKDTNGSDLLTQGLSRPTTSAGKNGGASDDTGHGRHYFHGRGAGLPSFGSAGVPNEQGGEGHRSRSTNNATNDARDAMDVDRTRARQEHTSTRETKTEMSAEWWDQMSGGTLHNEEEARAERERQLLGAMGDMTPAEREAYVEDQAEYQRAGITSEAEAREMEARQRKEVESGQVYRGSGSSGTPTKATQTKPNPDSTDGTPTPIDHDIESARPTIVEQEEARRRQVTLPSEGGRDRDRVYMDRADLNEGFVTRQTDGRSQPIQGDGTTEGSGGTSLSGRYSPRPGNLGDPAPTDGDGTGGDPASNQDPD